MYGENSSRNLHCEHAEQCKRHKPMCMIRRGLFLPPKPLFVGEGTTKKDEETVEIPFMVATALGFKRIFILFSKIKMQNIYIKR